MTFLEGGDTCHNNENKPISLLETTVMQVFFRVFVNWIISRWQPVIFKNKSLQFGHSCKCTFNNRYTCIDTRF